MTKHTPKTFARREILKLGAATALATPMLWTGARAQSGRVIVRNTGGAYEEAMRQAVYDPFTAETGIEVISVPATFGKLMAMFRSGNIELDVMDVADSSLIKLEKEGALAPIDYDNWKYADPANIREDLRRENMVGNFLFATVLGYSTEAFPDRHPTSWKEFWDVETFPGARMLADIASGQPNLEFALLADGVAMKDLYPLDIDRAFTSMGRIHEHILRYWNSGALSAQLMANQEVLLGSIWNGRASAAQAKGAPVAIEWNENMLQLQAFGIFNGTPNPENAQLFVDFASAAKQGAAFGSALNYGPANLAAYDMISAEQRANMPGSPALAEQGFLMDSAWWEEHREEVGQRWSNWVIQ